jgi:uncharacterized membrane protein YbhN (UPF0104 family)
MTTSGIDYRVRATAGTLVRLGCGAAVLAFVLSRVDVRSVTLHADGRAAAGLAVTVALVALAQCLSAFRWRLVLGDAGAPFGYLLRLYLVGLFFSLFLPSSVGGDGVRAVAVSRSSRRPAWAVSSVVFERFLGVIALFALLAIGAAASPEAVRGLSGRVALPHPPPLVLVVGGVAMLVLGMIGWRLAARSERVRAGTADAAALWAGLWTRPRTTAAALGVSVLVQGTYVAAWWQLAEALGLRAPAGAFLVFVPLVSIAAMIPLTISGIGLREGAWALLLAPYGVPAANAVAYSLFYFLAFVLVGAAGGVAFAIRGIAPATASPESASASATTEMPVDARLASTSPA